jgi:hypothetical protein
MVESNRTLCGLLNIYISTFVVLNFENKSLSLVFCCDLLSMLLFLHCILRVS